MPVSHPLHRLFRPRSIAVVGASRDETKIGHIVINNIVQSGFTGTIYPINPKLDYFGALRAYGSLTELPRQVDLAIIAIPAEVVLAVVEEAGKKGISNILIFSAGFKESGIEGEAREEKLKALADTYKLNILGPNCLGFVSTGAALNATFGQVANTIGPLRFISQSGAIATGLFDWAASADVGFTDVVTLGNKTMIAEHHVMDYLLQHKHSDADRKRERDAGYSGYQPVGMYLESIADGHLFAQIAKHIAANDPVFVLHPGASEGAREAMQSHTGAIAGADATISTALASSGVIRCESAQDLFDLSRLTSWEQAPAGPRVAIVSNAGGPGVLATDALENEGLTLAKIDEKTQKSLAKILPRSASVHNPVDVLGDALADRYAKAAKVLLAKKDVDALLVILTPQIMTQIHETAEHIGKLSKKYKKPIVCSFMGGSRVAEGEEVLNEYRIPSFHYPERALRALGKLWWWQSWRMQKQTKSKVLTLPKKNVNAISELVEDLKTQGDAATGNGCAAIFSGAGITIPASTSVASVKEAEAFAMPNGYPVVMKLVSPTLLHKSDIGGVWTDLEKREHLTEAFGALETSMKKLKKSERAHAHIEIQQQIVGGIELIVGVKRDPQYGPILVLGSGGVYAELFDDAVSAMLPMGKKEIEALLAKTKISKILSGYRGETAYATAALVDMIQKICAIIEAVPEIKELEINPAIVTHERAFAVDGKCIFT